jgi:hypothetical protein
MCGTSLILSAHKKVDGWDVPIFPIVSANHNISVALGMVETPRLQAKKKIAKSTDVNEQGFSCKSCGATILSIAGKRSLSATCCISRLRADIL